MPRGKKKSHKGGHRHFTSEDDLALEAEKARRQQEWRAKKGIESDEEEAEGEEEEKPVATASKPGELPPAGSESEEGEDEEEEEEEEDKPKGVSHLIEVENPNRVKPKTKKVTSISLESKGQAAEPNLSRKEREELEKQQAKDHYQKLHMAGKTEEARSDLARLALIRKQREEAAKKREDEKKAADDAKSAAEQRLLDKKQKAGGGDKK